MRGFCRGYRRGFGHGRGFCYGINAEYGREFKRGYRHDRGLGMRIFNKCLDWGHAFGRCFRGRFGFRRWER